MLDRLDPADAQGVGDDRAGRTAPTLGRDPLQLGEPHQVPADQEELGESGPLDHVELVGEAIDDGRGQRVIALAGTGVAQPDEIAERRLPVRHREAREAVLLEAEVDRARRRQRHRGRDPLAPGSGRRLVQRHSPGEQLLPACQVRLAIGPAQVAERIQRPAMADRGQDIVELAVLAPGVMDVVGDDDRQPELGRERRRLRHEPVVVGQEMVRELDEEAARGGIVAAPEPGRIPLGDGARPGPIADPQPARQLPVATTRQRNDALVVLGQERLADAGDGLGPGQVGMRQQPAQAPPAHLGADQQHQVRPPGALTDAAEVLLHRIAMPGQSGTVRTRPGGPTLDDERAVGCQRLPGSSPPTTGRHDHATGIGNGRIDELDLHADDGVEAGVLGRPDEPDRPVQAVVVGGGQAGQTQLHGPRDQLVRSRGAIEEREVGMRVQLGVRDGRHGSLRSGAGSSRGLVSIEQTFYPVTTKHNRWVARPTRMQAPIHPVRPLRPVATTALRTALTAVVATLLILVLLPAVIAAQAATI